MVAVISTTRAWSAGRSLSRTLIVIPWAHSPEVRLRPAEIGVAILPVQSRCVICRSATSTNMCVAR